MKNEELIALFNKQASRYDKQRRKKNSFDHKWRKKLLSLSKGKILEVSVGAGANFKFYPPGVDITAVDISPVMIEKAKASAIESGIHVNFITSAIEDLNFTPESFNTIVSTFSLCTYNDPVHLLNRFNKWCKKDGLILFLEHGESNSLFVRWVQNKYDRFQFRNIGCHTNRNIIQIIKHSKLEIEMIDRRLMGIIYLIWARPRH